MGLDTGTGSSEFLFFRYVKNLPRPSSCWEVVEFPLSR